MVPYSLSFYDLLKFPLFKIAAKQDDKELMKEIFYQAGIDTVEKFEIVEVLHRPVTSKEPWFGLRVHGSERLDKEWLQTDVASFEAKTYTKDKSLRDTLAALDPNNAIHKKKSIDDDRECDVDTSVFEENCV